MECDFLVVGAGPAGAMFASSVADRAKTVVLEEHERVGQPVQCTGLVAPRVVEMVGARDTVINRLDAVTFHFPAGGTLDIQGKGTKAVVLDRARFDQHCMEKAVDRGAELRQGERFLGLSLEGEGVNVRSRSGNGSSSYLARLIIGADGYKSNVAKNVGLGQPKDTVRGIQMDVAHRLDDQKRVHVFVGKDVAPGFFAWEIPCDDFTRVGVCVSRGRGPPVAYLNVLLKRLGMAQKRRISIISGIIPLGPPSRTYAERVMLLGDAAGQAKPLSGGGIYTGMVAGRCAAATALESLQSDDFSPRALSIYQLRWKEEIGKELERGYMLRKAYVRLQDKKLDEVRQTLDRPEVLSLLSDGDIDFPTVLASSILKAAPSLIKFAPQFLRSVLWH